MKRICWSLLGTGAVLAILSTVSAQEPTRSKDPPPSQVKGERAPPRDRQPDSPPGRTPSLGLDERGARERPSRGEGQPQRREEGFRPPGQNPRGGSFGTPDGRGRSGGFGQGFGPGGGGGFPGGPGMGPGGPRDLYQDDPEMASLNDADRQLDEQTRQLARQLPSADDRDKVKDQIAELIMQHFEVRQKRRELQIKRMEDELKKLREAMTKRNESRDLIIKRRLAELVGNEDDLGF